MKRFADIKSKLEIARTTQRASNAAAILSKGNALSATGKAGQTSLQEMTAAAEATGMGQTSLPEASAME